MQHHFKIFIYNVYAKHTNSAMVIELRNNFRYFRKYMKKKRCEYLRDRGQKAGKFRGGVMIRTLALKYRVVVQ